MTAGAIVAVFAVPLLLRFIVLSELGVQGAWIYFGLPIGGIGVLVLRLGLLNFGSKPGRPRRRRDLWQEIDRKGVNRFSPACGLATAITSLR